MNTEHIELLRFSTAGNVDDGKSTLTGRLLYDSKSIFEDQYEMLKDTSSKRGEKGLNLALLVDGLKAEREQGITIDVAYRYFATPKRRFIIADTPGHTQYTRNMVTGASTANLALILIDARKGLAEQTRRHAFIASLLQIPHLLICINKMDLVNYSEDVYEKIKAEFLSFSDKLAIKDVHFIPVSALKGDNVVNKSANMNWYAEETLMHYLENIYIQNDHNFTDCRFPVQLVIQPDIDDPNGYCGYAGRILGGVFRPGDKVVVLPSGFTSEIAKIDTFDGELKEAFPPMSVTILLKDKINVSRGDMIVKENNLPRSTRDLEVMICCFNENKLRLHQKYIIRHTTQEIYCVVKKVRYKLDINKLTPNEKDLNIGMNDIARIVLRTDRPLFTDSYRHNRHTGGIILVNEQTNETIAAGMII